MTHRETLVHLAGYTTIALILGTATWSTLGWMFALPLLGATIAYAAHRGVEWLRVLVHEPTDQGREAVSTSSTAGARDPATSD